MHPELGKSMPNKLGRVAEDFGSLMWVRTSEYRAGWIESIRFGFECGSLAVGVDEGNDTVCWTLGPADSLAGRGAIDIWESLYRVGCGGSGNLPTIVDFRMASRSSFPTEKGVTCCPFEPFASSQKPTRAQETAENGQRRHMRAVRPLPEATPRRTRTCPSR